MKSRFKRSINWNKYQSKNQRKLQTSINILYVNILFINILFVLTFDVNTNILGQSRYYLSTVKEENFNAIVDVKNFFDQRINNDIKTYENIRKITQLLIC